ncbi:MAG: TetR/AcrR family transcriptional regulator [Planctomycetota bacterium]|nr:TetR/AcrR family transcriptional regulator [Planctomycetota bacterium]
MKKRKRLSAADRRDQLVDVGRSVFAKLGYEGTTVEEVARKAKISKPIVYEHFGGKEGLYAVIIDREMELLYSRVAESIDTGSPRERFEKAISSFLTYVRERPDGFAVLTRDAPGSSGRGMRSVISDLGERITEIFQKEFKRAGLNPKLSPLYSHALIGMVTSAGQWWMGSRGISQEKAASHLAAIGWMGLRHIPEDPTMKE